MKLEIYDGQHGTKISPYDPTEDKKIKRFFNEQIELYIEKTDNNMAVYCKIRALKTADRVEVFYVVYHDTNGQDYFSRFKDEVEKALNGLDLKLTFNKDTDNIIFKNIQLFSGQSSGITFKDFDDIMYIIDKHKRPGLKAGKINDIAVFCIDILKNRNNVEIGIAAGNDMPDEGDVNILLDKNSKMPLTLIDSTKKILEDRKKELEKIRKDEIKRCSNEEITHGISTVVQGIDKISNAVDKMKNAGCSTSEIGDIIEPKIKPLNKLLQTEIIEFGQKPRIGAAIVGATIVTALIAGIVIGMIIQPYLSGSFLEGSSVGQEDTVPIINTASTPVATEVTTPGITSTVKSVLATNGTVLPILNKTDKTNGTDNVSGTDKTNGTDNVSRTDKTNGTDNKTY